MTSEKPNRYHVNPLRLLLIALQFLTRLPIVLRAPPTDGEVGRSLLCYPLVGLLLGCLLAGVAQLLHGHLAPLPAAALLLAVWVGASGGLHLDGLADSADAWAGGRGNPERALAIMKDPNCGPLGVVALVVVLLLKFAALATLADIWPLLLAPLLGRAALLPLFMTTDYVRTKGLGSAMHAHLPRRAAWLLLVLIGTAIVLALGGRAVAPCLTALAAFLLLRWLMLNQIGGMTGDTAGALVETVETAVLLGCTWA